MAIVTYTVASFANELVRAEVDLDDNNLRVRVARVINDSDYPAHIEVFKAGTSVGSRDCPPHSTKSRNLPATVRLKAIPQPDPEEHGPISMGDIEIYARCPA